MAPTRLASKPSEQFRTVVRNGYTYQIDLRERTRRVFGILTVTDASIRSRTLQRQAGGAERRASDDGGHYIAARFHRPSERSIISRRMPTSIGAVIAFSNDRRRIVATDNSENLLNEIGQLLMAAREYPLEPTLLYAQLDYNTIGKSIFKRLSNHFLYRWPVNERLPYALLELWESQEGKDRWTELQYVLRDGLFEVAYIYPDAIDPEEDILERREHSLLQQLGNKPVIYPPLPPEDDASDHDV